MSRPNAAGMVAGYARDARRFADDERLSDRERRSADVAARRLSALAERMERERCSETSRKQRNRSQQDLF